MSNSALEQKKKPKREYNERQRLAAAVNSAEGPLQRKSTHQLSNSRHQPSQASLSEADPTQFPSNHGGASNGAKRNDRNTSVDNSNSTAKMPIMRCSSNQPGGIGGNSRVASHDSNRHQQKLLLRFLSSDDCNSSQSIFSSSSDSQGQQAQQREIGGRKCSIEAAALSCNSRNRKRGGHLADSDEADIDSCPQTAGLKYDQQNSSQNNKSFQHQNAAVSRNRIVSSDPYFSSNTTGPKEEPKSSTSYYGGSRPKALYQSLVNSKLTSDHGDSVNVLAAVTMQDQSAVEILDSAGSQGVVLSEQKLENVGITSQNGVSAENKKSKEKHENSEAFLRRQILRDMPPMELTSVRRYYSLKPDMAFGWRPEDIHGAPIPMHFDYEQNELPTRPDTGHDFPIYYIGNRFNDSLDMHQRFANKIKMLGPDEISSYNFKFPPNQNVIDAMGRSNTLKAKQQNGSSVTKMFKGMSPLLSEVTVDQALSLLKNQGKDWSRDFLQRQMTQLKKMAGPKEQHLIFDSSFESGNLDMAIQVNPVEYDMYMRVDSNTRGHHQWFYFKAQNQQFTGTVKFNFVNFTKRQSLYMQGMRVNVKSMLDIADQKAKLAEGVPATSLKNEGWVKCGDNITYKLSKLSVYSPGANGGTLQNPNAANNAGEPIRGKKKYYMLQFQYTFNRPNDEVYFAYALPYTFSKLHSYIKQTMDNHTTRVRVLEQSQQKGTSPEAFKEEAKLHVPLPVGYSEYAYIKESRFCHSLSGLEVPELTITSQVNKLSGRSSGAPLEIDPNEFDDKTKLPPYKDKKYMIVAARVHPGESNSSFIMQGFLKFIISQQPEAVELRKRVVFKVVPMTNPDGVIAGNYRTSLSGNDLNRQFLTPNPKLHPTVDAIKKLCRSILAQARQPEPFLGFIDIHGHSRKKSVFMYGPHFPLHNEKYFKSKVLPKLLDDRTQMFRFYSCKFRIERSKLKTARVVLFKEFGIMNCFTLEASFHGFIDTDRKTAELTTETLQDMGETLGLSLSDYLNLFDQEERQKAQIREQLKLKKKKLKARDITRAIIKQEKSAGAQRGESVQSEDTDVDVVVTAAANSLRLNRPQGIRSLSIQNNSTKVSSFSDTHSDGEKSNSRKPGSSAVRSTRNGEDTGNVGGIITSDIMELISEEELSVCRSEGSPPRKPKKRKTQHVQIDSGCAIPPKNKPKLGGNNAAAVTTGKKNLRSAGGLSNFRLKPDRTKRLSDAGHLNSSTIASDELKSGSNTKKVAAGVGGALTSMKAIMDQIKRQQEHENSSEYQGIEDGDENEDYLDDDESSCGKSFSGDELSEGELRAVQGDILGAIKRFDDLYNKKDPKDRKYSRERTDQRKAKKVQQRETRGNVTKEHDLEQKKRKKSKRDDLIMAAKHAQPSVTQPFQVKGSGNGGNSCTLVMERIMQQRHQSQQQQQVNSGVVIQGSANTTGAKRSVNEAFGFMQRHKKSLNPSEKELYNRAITDINFNVPKTTSNLEPAQATKPKQMQQVTKRRDNSQNNSNSSVPVGLKGLAAISDMRNSKNAEAMLKQMKAAGKDRDSMKSTERVDQDAIKGKSMTTLGPKGSNQVFSSKPNNRLLKPSGTSVTAKSPTNGGGSISGAKSSKIPPRSTKPGDSFKKQSIIATVYEDSVSMPPLTSTQSKQTPVADSFSEPINFAKALRDTQFLSKSQSKTLQVSPPFTCENLPKVHQPISTMNQLYQGDKSLSAQKFADFNERLNKGMLAGSQSNQQQQQSMQSQNHNDLEQPKIISMTLNLGGKNNGKPQYQHISHAGSLTNTTHDYISSQANNRVSIHNKANVAVSTSSFRIKNNTKSVNKRQNLGSQRCSSGTIGARNSKVSSLIKENAFLSKVNNNGSNAVVPSAAAPKQNFSLKTSHLAIASSGQPVTSNNQPLLNQAQLSCPHSSRQRPGIGVIGHHQVAKTIGSQQNLDVTGTSAAQREELEQTIAEREILNSQQAQSAFAMVNSRIGRDPKSVTSDTTDGPKAVYSYHMRQMSSNKAQYVSTGNPNSVTCSNASGSLGHSLNGPHDALATRIHVLSQESTQMGASRGENFPLKTFTGGQHPSQHQHNSASGNTSNKVFDEIGNLTAVGNGIQPPQVRTANVININKQSTVVSKQSNSSMRVRSLGKQNMAPIVANNSNPGTISHPSSKASDIFTMHQHNNNNGGSKATSGHQSTTNDSAAATSNANGGVHFQKIMGLHKFVVNKTAGTSTKQMSNSSAATQSMQQQSYGMATNSAAAAALVTGSVNNSNQLQQHLMQRRRNLKAPSVHSMSATGINGILNSQSSGAGSGSTGGPNSVATLNMSAHNVQEMISQAVRREATRREL